MRMTKIKNNQMRSQKLKTAGFYTLLVILPLTQFVLFYVCVNFNSILLALKSYDPLTLKVEKLGFQNFSQIFYESVYIADGDKKFRHSVRDKRGGGNVERAYILLLYF